MTKFMKPNLSVGMQKVAIPPKIELSMLMEKLRSKSASQKSWDDCIKSVRNIPLDKIVFADEQEQYQLEQCLDTLQMSLQPSSLHDMIERLENISRQLKLKFHVASNTNCFISSEMFYVEVVLDMQGKVIDVKVAHQSDREPQSCVDLIKVIQKCQFQLLGDHLEGFSSIYSFHTDKKIKTKAWVALSALENDLSHVAHCQNTILDVNNLIHKSPLGIVQLRKGGLPMKFIYFVSPYDLLDVAKGCVKPLTTDTILSSDLGHYVSLTITESVTMYRLQTQSLITLSRTDGKNLPSFSPLTPQNSMIFPAVFTLHLPHPCPMHILLVKQIQQISGVEISLPNPQCLINLLVQQASDSQLDLKNQKCLFVTLPDQQHCYFIPEAEDLQGVLISSIPFCHPTQVPQILVLLRQQLHFNELIKSCVRPQSKQDLDASFSFELHAQSSQEINIIFQHPCEESLSVATFNLEDIANITCQLYTLHDDVYICSKEFASQILRKSISIPVTMRAIIQKTQRNFRQYSNKCSKETQNLISFNQNIKMELPKTECINTIRHPQMSNISNIFLVGVNRNRKRKLETDLSNLFESDLKKNIGNENDNKFQKMSVDASEIHSLGYSMSNTPNDQLGIEKKTENEKFVYPTINEHCCENDNSETELEGTDMESMEATLETLGLSVLPVPNNNKSEKKEKRLPKLKLDGCSIHAISDSQGSPVVVEFSDKSSLTALSITTVSNSSSTTSFSFSDSSIHPSYLSLELEKRPGIEIIPILSNSPDDSSSEERNFFRDNDKIKNRKNSDSEKKRKDKKKKRDEVLLSEKHNMGPPLQCLTKSNEKQDSAVLKPLTLSIRPQNPVSPVYTPKHETLNRQISPKLTAASNISAKLSSSPKSQQGYFKSNFSASPKHSISSPKQVSPKMYSNSKVSLSPKIPQSSGKPSLSALKSASPLMKSSSPTPKQKKRGSNSPATQNIQMKGNKIKQSLSGSSLPLTETSNNCNELEAVQRSTSFGNLSMPGNGHNKNRKNSLSAVIDKLRSAQNPELCRKDYLAEVKDKKDKKLPEEKLCLSSKTESKDKSNLSSKKAEFVVKPSLQGLKLMVTKKNSDGSAKLSSLKGVNIPKDRADAKSLIGTNNKSCTGFQQNSAKSVLQNSCRKLKTADSPASSVISSPIPSTAQTGKQNLFANSSVAKVKPTSPKFGAVGEGKIKDKATKLEKKLQQKQAVEKLKTSGETDVEKTFNKLLQSWGDSGNEQKPLAKYKIPKREIKQDAENNKVMKPEISKPGTVVIRSDSGKVQRNEISEEKSKAEKKCVGVLQISQSNTNAGFKNSVSSSPKLAVLTSDNAIKHEDINCNDAKSVELKSERGQAINSLSTSQPLNLVLHKELDGEKERLGFYSEINIELSEKTAKEHKHGISPLTTEEMQNTGKKLESVHKIMDAAKDKNFSLNCKEQDSEEEFNIQHSFINSTQDNSPDDNLVIDIASEMNSASTVTNPAKSPLDFNFVDSTDQKGAASLLSNANYSDQSFSPLTLISPKSEASPFLIDDDLMDEALLLKQS